MESQLNLYILSEKALVVCGLKHFLQERFGTKLKIFNFYNRKTCLKKINRQTQVVVVDQFLSGTSGVDVQRSIKTINPQVEVIMHSSNEDVASVISSLCDQTIKPANGLGLWLKNHSN